MSGVNKPSEADVRTEEERIKSKYKEIIEVFGPGTDAWSLKGAVDGEDSDGLSMCVEEALARLPDENGDQWTNDRIRVKRELVVGQCIKRIGDGNDRQSHGNRKQAVSRIVDDIVEQFGLG